MENNSIDKQRIKVAATQFAAALFLIEKAYEVRQNKDLGDILIDAEELSNKINKLKL